jgi:transglutaminase-like putative cysteine protease
VSFLQVPREVPRLEGARLSFALAHLASLVLLARVSPNGAWSLGAGLAVALVATIPPQPRGLKTDLSSLARVGAAVCAGGVLLGTLFFLQSQVPGSALAWFGRLAALVGLVSLSRTPSRLLGGHALLVALALWNAAACEDAIDPPPLGLGIASLALLLCLRGVLTGHREQIEQRAARSITTGVAPTPWGRSPLRLPVLLVLALALVPLGLGVALPRWPLEEPSVTASGVVAPTPSTYKGPTWDIGFSPEVRADEARGAGFPGDAEIARVRLDPAPPALYLRGAELSRATQRGFFPPLTTSRPLGISGGPDSGPLLQLQVELLRAQSNALFVVGRPRRFLDVPAIHTRQGWQIKGPASYPLTYRLEARGLASVRDTDLLREAERGEFLGLPEGVARDAELRSMAQRVAWGRSAHARVTNLSRWLQERCAYSLQRERPAGLTLRQVLEHFLVEKRVGVCEEFAMAAVVFLRLVKVPARVVTGYRSVERDDQGRFRVRARHAHAWIEVAYEGLGWVPYDPTPPLPGSEASATTSPSPSPSPSAKPGPAPKAARPPGGLFAGLDRLQLLRAAGDPSFLVRVAILFGAGLLIYLTRRGAVVLRRTQRARQLGPAPATVPLDGVRSRLFALLEARGFYLDGAETPREFLEARPDADPALVEAVEVYLPLRFSGRAEPAVRDRLEALLAGLERSRR